MDLIDAIILKDTKASESLLAKGPNPNRYETGVHALYFAAQTGSWDTCLTPIATVTDFMES